VVRYVPHPRFELKGLPLFKVGKAEKIQFSFPKMAFSVFLPPNDSAPKG
jgi:hypothetical protein